MMLEELQRRHYSEATTQRYIRLIERFAQHFHCSPDRLGPRHIREYQAQLFTVHKLTPGSVTNHLCALRFLYIQTLKRPWSIADTPYPKKRYRLPPVLSQEEVAQLIDAAPGNSSTVCCFAPVQKLYSKWLVIPPISEPRSASSACSIPGTRNSNFIPMSTVSFPPADSPAIMPAGFDPTHASSFPLLYCGACFVASSSPASSLPSRTANCTWPENSHPSPIPSSSLPGCVRSSAKTGSSTPNHPSVDPSTSCSISAAIPTAWPSLTIAWLRWPTTKSPFAGVTLPTTIGKN